MAKIELFKPSIQLCEDSLPGFKRIWPKIKERTRTTQRAPKRLIFQDVAEEVRAYHDGECIFRFRLDLTTMELSEGTYVSSGERAINSGGKEKAISPPQNFATVDCVVLDYHRTFRMVVTVAPGMLPKQIEAKLMNATIKLLAKVEALQKKLEDKVKDCQLALDTSAKHAKRAADLDKECDRLHALISKVEKERDTFRDKVIALKGTKS